MSIENFAGASDGSVGVDAYKAAEERGLDVILPEDDQLFIDVDSNADAERLYRAVGILERYGIQVDMEKFTVSASGGDHRHYYLRIKGIEGGITPVERILLQAVLGSDRTRELLSFVRIKKGVSPATVFFEKPKKPREAGASDGASKGANKAAESDDLWIDLEAA